MGRGKFSKMERKTNRAMDRGNKLGGTQHCSVKGKKWSRRDVLELRKLAKQEESVGSALYVEKWMKSLNKANRIRSIEVMKPLRSNAE